MVMRFQCHSSSMSPAKQYCTTISHILVHYVILGNFNQYISVQAHPPVCQYVSTIIHFLSPATSLYHCHASLFNGSPTTFTYIHTIIITVNQKLYKKYLN